MLPKNLIYVRHGQSERNLASKEAHQGNTSLLEQIINRPTSTACLTERGRQQAVVTGEWLRAQGLTFQRWYTSSYVRAKETAGLLDLPNASWYIENSIRERSSGVMEDMTPDERARYLGRLRNRVHLLDLVNFRPDRGDSYADKIRDLKLFVNTLYAECDHMDAVCVVNHGDNMWCAMSIHERWTPEDFMENRGLEAHGKIPNCMVLHYTRVNPDTGDVIGYPGWVRTCCPWKDPTPTPWRRVVRKRYTSQELLEQVSRSKEIYAIKEAS